MSITFFLTKDFHLATTLVTLGYKLHNIDRPPTGRAEFMFERVDGLDEAIESFWCRSLHVEPMIFCANQKMLKAQLYSE